MQSTQKTAERVWQLGNLMCSAADEHLFTTVYITDNHRTELGGKIGWAGGEPTNASSARPPYISQLKALDLLMDFRNPFALSPSGRKVNSEFKGGVRRYLSDDMIDMQLVTACSAWDQHCDLLFSLVLNYAMDREVRFHHVGFGYATEAEMMIAVHADEQKLGVAAINVPASDHTRFYIKVLAPDAPNLFYWREHQWGPKVIRSNSIHWDLATTDPEGLLQFVGEPLEGPEIWERSPNAPVGSIWQMNRGERPFGIMARPNWWAIN